MGGTGRQNRMRVTRRLFQKEGSVLTIAADDQGCTCTRTLGFFFRPHLPSLRRSFPRAADSKTIKLIACPGLMHRLAATVRRGVHSPSSHTPWASLQIKRPTRGGAFSTFKYYSTISRYHLTQDLTPSDHDLKAIQDTLEGLHLMSQLKYLSVLSLPVLLSGSPPHLAPTLGPKASQDSRT